MTKDPVQRYAESLERIIEQNYQFLKENVENFRELCLLVTPEREVPQEVIIDIRQLYKEIQNRLSEIKAIQQLLQGKYRQYYRRNPLRDREIMEVGFLVKNLFSKVEFTLLQKQARFKRREEISRVEPKGLPFQWFRLRDHQILFIRTLRILRDLYYEDPSESGAKERREISQDKGRGVTLFSIQGESNLINVIYLRCRLREYDVIERFSKDELRGLLTHLRDISSGEVEALLRRFIEDEELKKVKCLLLRIQSLKALKEDIVGEVKMALEQMAPGEIKTVFL
ncbi:MAG: hypothetical protein ACUVT6_07340 [Thermodesulfobacteriota bacterium]